MADQQEQDKLEMAGLKVPASLKQKFMALRGDMTHIEYAEHLVSLVESDQVAGGTDSPVIKEQTEIELALAKVGRICNSTITLAAERSISYKEDADKIIEAARAEVTEFKVLVAGQKELLENLGKEKIETDKVVAGLQNQAESTSTLKEAWSEKEASLNGRIIKLDAEAQESRDLKEQIVELEKALADMEKTLAAKDKDLSVAEQKLESEAERIIELNIRIDNLTKNYESEAARIRTQGRDALEVEVARNAKALEKAEEAQKKRIVDLKESHQTSIATEKEKTKAAVVDHQNYIVETNKNFESIMSGHQLAIEAMRSEHRLAIEDLKELAGLKKVEEKPKKKK